LDAGRHKNAPNSATSWPRWRHWFHSASIHHMQGNLSLAARVALAEMLGELSSGARS
jgi:hypothetical protein